MSEQEFGSDGQVHPVDRPLVPFAAAKKRDAPDDIFAASEPASAAQRLRAFEDEHLGPDAPRVDGKVERGHGSLFSRLNPDQRAHHTKIEHLVHSEDKLAQAATKLSEAQVEHDQAVAALEQPDESKNGSG